MARRHARTSRSLLVLVLIATVAFAWVRRSSRSSQRSSTDTLPSWPPMEPAATAATSARFRDPVDGACPDGFPIKASQSGIFHVPGGRSYERTRPARCYASPAEAEADGYRRAKA